MSATTAQVFRLPDLGEGLTEAEVMEWHVGVGDQVGIDQEVVTVETAKAAVEVPCPYAGAVVELHAEPGTVLAVGAPLITISDGAGEEWPGRHASPTGNTATGDTVGTEAASGDSASGDSAADPEGERHRTEERAGARTPDPDAADEEAPERPLIGYGAGTGPARRSRAGRRRAAAGTGVGTTLGTSAGSDSTGWATAGRAVRVISPLVRKLAKEWDIDLSAVRPGPTGVIRRADLEAFRGTAEPVQAAAADAAVSAGAVGAWAAGAGADGAGADGAGAAAGRRDTGGDDVRIPIQGVQRLMVERLTTSRREIPDATTWVDVDATRLMKTKDALKAARPDAGIGVLPLLARIVVSGLTAYPALNSSVDLEAEEIVQHGRIHLGFAAQSPRGLVVPVVRDAESMTTTELASALRELTEKARDGKLAPAELTGGTFTLNNYGVFGVDGSTPIINHPEAAMLGIGRIVDKPWVHRGRLKVRRVTQLSFTFDHRVCDGGTAGGFLRHVADLVEQPAALLADL